jgi:hypothetical protein
MITKIDKIKWLLENEDGIIIKYTYYDEVAKELRHHITVNDRKTHYLYAIIDTYTFERMVDSECIIFACEMGINTNAYILNN